METEFPKPLPRVRPWAAISAGVWSIVGLLVGAITGQCVWDTLCYGDFGAGAWVGGMLTFLLTIGVVGGVANASSSLGQRAGYGATAAVLATGAILGGVGLPGLFVFVLLTVRSCFEGAGESLKSAESNAQMVLLASLLGWTAGLILGASQGCVNRWLGDQWARVAGPFRENEPPVNFTLPHDLDRDGDPVVIEGFHFHLLSPESKSMVQMSPRDQPVPAPPRSGHRNKQTPS